MRPKIPNKRTFYALAQSGVLGNVPRMWFSYADFCADGMPLDCVGVRCLTPGDKRFTPFVPRDVLEQKLSELGLREGEYILSETLPEGCHRIQGELSYIKGNLVFFHSFLATPMRAALRDGGKHACGWCAKELLKQYASPADVDDLLGLLDYYSCGGIYETCAEITVPTIPFGMFPRRSVILWELRNY